MGIPGANLASKGLTGSLRKNLTPVMAATKGLRHGQCAFAHRRTKLASGTLVDVSLFVQSPTVFKNSCFMHLTCGAPLRLECPRRFYIVSLESWLYMEKVDHNSCTTTHRKGFASHVTVASRQTSVRLRHLTACAIAQSCGQGRSCQNTPATAKLQLVHLTFMSSVARK